MHTSKRRLLIIKSGVLIVGVLIGVFGIAGYFSYGRPAEASASGPSASHTNAPGEDNCTACHTDFAANSGTGSVAISGVPAVFSPGQSIPVTVTTSQADAVIYGFQLTAIDLQGKRAGTYTLPTQTPMQIKTIMGIVDGNTREYVEHTVDGLIPLQFGSKSWTFNWTAPAQR